MGKSSIRHDQKSEANHYVIGMDIGGTKVLSCLYDLTFKLIAKSKSPINPHKGIEFFQKLMLENIGQLIEKSQISMSQIVALGAGCPGIIKHPEGIIKISPNIQCLKQFKLKKFFKDRFNIPIAIENDVNAGLYGEQQFGAAKNFQHVIGMFLGTGVGGALIFNGQIYRGSTGAAGEVGHMFIDPPKFSDPLGHQSTLESQLGRLSIASDAGYLGLLQKAPHLYEEVKDRVKKIKSGVLSRSIQGGDKSVEDLLLQKARILGLHMASLVHLLSPELFVLGGGTIEALEKIIIPEATKVMHQYAMQPLVSHVKVATAQLGDFSVSHGAAKLALDEWKKSHE